MVKKLSPHSISLILLALSSFLTLFSACGERTTEKGDPFFINPNTPPSLQILGPTTLKTGESANYILQTSDVDGDPTFANLKVNGGQLNFISEREYQFISPLISGNYILTGTVQDSRGGAATSTLSLQVEGSANNIDVTLTGLNSAVLINDSQTLTVSVNTDSLTDLTFTWGSTGGSFKRISGGEFFTTLTTEDKSVTFKAPSSTGLHTLTLVVTSKTGVKKVISRTFQVVSSSGISDIFADKPVNGDFNVSIQNPDPLQFIWSGGDDATGATVTYDLYLARGDLSLILVRSNLSAASKTVTIERNDISGLDPISGLSLEFLTTYKWKIVAKGSNGFTRESRVFTFTSAPDTARTLYVDNRVTSPDLTKPLGNPNNPHTNLQSALSDPRIASPTDLADTIFILGNLNTPYVANSPITLPPVLPKPLIINGSNSGSILFSSNRVDFTIASFSTTQNITVRNLIFANFSSNVSNPAVRLGGSGIYTLESTAIQQSAQTPNAGVGLLYTGPTVAGQSGGITLTSVNIGNCNTGFMGAGLPAATNQITFNTSRFAGNATGLHARTGSFTYTFTNSTITNNTDGFKITQAGNMTIGRVAVTPGTRFTTNSNHGIHLVRDGALDLNFGTLTFLSTAITSNGEVNSAQPLIPSLNTGHGLFFEGPSAAPATMTFQGCNISSNFQNGLFVKEGSGLSVNLAGIRNDLATENIINNNKWSGIQLDNTLLSPVNLSLFKTRLVNNGYNGLIASNTILVGNSNWSHNTFANNASYGLNLNGTTNVFLEDNIIANNTKGQIVENYYLILNETNGAFAANAAARASDVAYLSLRYNDFFPLNSLTSPIFLDFNPDLLPTANFGTTTLTTAPGGLNSSTTFNLTALSVEFNIASDPQLINITTANPLFDVNAANPVKTSNFNGVFQPAGVPGGFNPGSGIRLGIQPELGAHGDEG